MRGPIALDTQWVISGVHPGKVGVPLGAIGCGWEVASKCGKNFESESDKVKRQWRLKGGKSVKKVITSRLDIIGNRRKTRERERERAI